MITMVSGHFSNTKSMEMRFNHSSLKLAKSLQTKALQAFGDLSIRDTLKSREHGPTMQDILL